MCVERHLHFTSEVAEYEAIAGYCLGGSSIAFFGRAGCIIYARAADMGANLPGEDDYSLEENWYQNAACIADGVSDNIGDFASMGADLFNSFAESTATPMPHKLYVGNCYEVVECHFTSEEA